jgi:hypothetical protein
MPENSDLKVIAFNCSLKSADEAKETSSTEKLVNQLLEEFAKHGAAGTIVRAVDHDIKPGVTSTKATVTHGPHCASKLCPAIEATNEAPPRNRRLISLTRAREGGYACHVLAVPVKKPKATWVRPIVDAEMNTAR